MDLVYEGKRYHVRLIHGVYDDGVDFGYGWDVIGEDWHIDDRDEAFTKCAEIAHADIDNSWRYSATQDTAIEIYDYEEHNCILEYPMPLRRK